MSEPQEQEAPALVTVFLTNATRTSAGVGPGPQQLPPEEAAALVANKIAVPGSRPPAGSGALR